MKQIKGRFIISVTGKNASGRIGSRVFTYLTIDQRCDRAELANLGNSDALDWVYREFQRMFPGFTIINHAIDWDYDLMDGIITDDDIAMIRRK